MGGNFGSEEDSFFGAPRNHDGQLYPAYPFFVESLDKIPVDGWQEMLKSTVLTWVVIPFKTHDAKN
jgi:hypothetical protein